MVLIRAGGADSRHRRPADGLFSAGAPVGPARRLRARRSGVRRQNVRFTDIKSEALSADGYQNFAGPTQLCQIIREEIRRNPGQGEDTYQRGKVWYARLAAGDLMLPVRMEFETAFGAVRGYLAELRGHGVHLI